MFIQISFSFELKNERDWLVLHGFFYLLRLSNQTAACDEHAEENNEKQRISGRYIADFGNPMTAAVTELQAADTI